VEEEQGGLCGDKGAALSRQRPGSDGNGRARPAWHANRGGRRGGGPECMGRDWHAWASLKE
jgi:hypothetical protein